MKIDLSDLLLIAAIALIISGSYLISWPVTIIAVGVLLIGAAWLVEKAAYIKRSKVEPQQTGTEQRA